MDRRLGWKINEFLLLLLILLQALDFFKLLSPFWDYVKKIVSWTLILYLLYQASPSTLFFGERKGWWDAVAIPSLFLLTLKNVVGFATAAREAMMGRILDFVGFRAADVTEWALTIPVETGELLTFQLTGYLAEASSYARILAQKLTLFTDEIPVLIAAGEESVGAVLQPYGLDGLTFQLYNAIVLYGVQIERVSFLVGGCLLLLLGTYAALRFPVRKPSVLNLLHEEGLPIGVGAALVRTLSVLFVIAAFFVILFNLVVEWLAIAVDAPLAMTGLAAYLLVAFRFRRRHHHGLPTAELVSRIGNFGFSFIAGFGKLFTHWHGVPLGLSGLLVLHLLVDIGNFILPALFGLKDILYFGAIGERETLLSLLLAAWGSDMGANLGLALLSALNAVGILTLLLLPAYIWYKAFRMATRRQHEPEEDHHPQLPSWIVGLCAAGIAAFLSAPAFAVRTLTGERLVGVDLATQPIASSDPLLVASLILGFGLLLFLVHLAAGRDAPLRDWLMTPLFLAAIGFFSLYIFRFFISAATYHLREGLSLLGGPDVSSLFLGFGFLLFLVLNLLFYVFGFVSFLYELFWGGDPHAP